MHRWIRYMRRGVAAFVIAGALLIGTGLGYTLTPQRHFDAFVEQLPALLVAPDDMSLPFLFADPTAYGVAIEPAALPYGDESDWEDSLDGVRFLQGVLDHFEPEDLSASSRLTRDILQDWLERQRLTAEHYWLSTGYLGSFTGFQAQLPLLLTEYPVRRQNDIDGLFHMLETAEETFVQYAALERQRQENGAGLSRTILARVIEQCETFQDSDVSFLVDAFSAKVDAADFLSAQDKEACKATGKTLIENNLRQAYRRLGEELSSIENAPEDGGLAERPGGQAFYQALFQQTTGSDMTIEEAEAWLTERLEQYLGEFTLLTLSLAKSDPEGLTAYMQAGQPAYGEFESAEQNLDYLREAMLADYPDVANLSYAIHTVPDAMKDNFSPAAYLRSPIDQPDGTPESIYINGAYSPSIFPTVAHEGYPGHMYQNAFFKAQKLPAVRYILDYNGYTEGWATYVENRSDRYAQDSDVAALHNASQRAVQMVICLLDIGIHYHGWDLEESAAFVGQYLNIPEESMREQYLLHVETPTNYLQYYFTGAQLEEMRRQAEQELGDAFSAVEFHRVLLATGPAPLGILQQQVDNWVVSVQAKAAA